jgi:serine/threonine protein kinase
MGCCGSKDEIVNQRLLVSGDSSVRDNAKPKLTHTDGLDLDISVCNFLINKGYALDSVLGKGKFSVVYKARHSDGKVALKITNKPVAAKGSPSRRHSSSAQSLCDEDIEASVKSEVAILKLVAHRNIIELVDFFEDENHFYMAEELIDGGELFDHIMQHVAYNENQARRYVRSLLSTVQYLHSLDVVHRCNHSYYLRLY